MSSNDESLDIFNGHHRKDSHQSLNRILTTSSRNSISSNASKYASGLTTTTSTFSSMEDTHQTSTANSSAIDFMNNNSIDENFDIIDTLDFDDIDEGIMDTEYLYRNRETVIESLLHSEEAYVESLELVIRLFYSPLKKDTNHSSFNFLGIKKMICTEREFKWLFGNFEELVQVHRLTLKSLQERLKIWGPTQILSDVFQAWFPNFECYRTYLSNYDVALTTYERLTRYQPFKKFLDSTQKDKALKGSSLLSLLQLPVGCIDRYKSIITKLVESTPPMHPDFASLQKTKAWIYQFHKSIQDKLIDAENVVQVLIIHQALLGAPFSVRAERRLILQAPMSRVVTSTKSAGEERHYILFSDLLVFVKPKQEGKVTKLQYKGHLVLERARVRPLSKEEAGGFPYCIEVVSSFSGVDNLNSTFIGSSTSHVLNIGNEQDRQQWLSKLESVIQNLDKIAAAKHAQATRRLIQSRAPKGSVGAYSSATSSNDETSSRDSTSYTS